MERVKRPASLLVGFILLTMCLVVAPATNAVAAKAKSGKKVGFTGDPSAKRGVEYGYDKGYQAGKKDKAAGLKPDPKRHEDFNKPEKYHRSEFGSQAAFVRGFKGGFVGGYQRAFGKKVKIKVPGLHQSPSEDSTAQPSQPAAPKPPDAASDAL